VNPFPGLYAAITRQDVFGRSPHGPVGWNEDEVLTRKEALDGFTISAAYASFQEDKLGSITPQKLADYIIVDRDVMTVEAKAIPETEVLATVIGGRVRYSKEGSPM
jgi:predicted amidohydrolase YtcJ